MTSDEALRHVIKITENASSEDDAGSAVLANLDDYREAIRPPATRDQIADARELYETEDVEIDTDAVLSECPDGAVWVSAWVYLAPEDYDSHRRNSDFCAKCGGDCYFDSNGKRVR